MAFEDEDSDAHRLFTPSSNLHKHMPAFHDPRHVDIAMLSALEDVPDEDGHFQRRHMLCTVASNAIGWKGSGVGNARTLDLVRGIAPAVERGARADACVCSSGFNKQ